MTRRARMGPIQTLGRGVDRMAPGGRRSASESPIRPFYRRVGEVGETPGLGTVTLRPVLLEGFIPSSGDPASSSTLTLIGGGGNGTLGDQTDTTFARMTSDHTGKHVGSVKATFETAAIEFDTQDVTLTCRVRTLAITPAPPPSLPGELSWTLTSPTGTVYQRSTAFSSPIDRWVPSSSWTDMTAQWSGSQPNSGAVAAGVVVYIQAFTYPFGGVGDMQLDVADVSLHLVGEPWEAKV